MRTRTLIVKGAILMTASTANVGGQGSTAASVLQKEVTSARTPGLQYIHVSRDSILVRVAAGHADVGREAPVTARTTFNGFSTTKTITAIAVLQLAERGLLDLDSAAARYVRHFPYPTNITVRNLLTHSGGIPNPIPLKWVHPANAHPTFDRNAFFRETYARHNDVTAAPNERFGYSNLGYELLGEIIEAVSGIRYEAYVRANILERIGVAESELGFTLDPARHAIGYHRRTSLSYPILRLLVDGKAVLGEKVKGWRAFRSYHMNGAAYGGLIGTAEGFSRYVQVLLDPAHPLLSAESRRILFAENVLTGGKASGMAASWFVGSLDGEPFFDHAGGGGGYYAEIRLYPGLGRGSVLLMNRTGLKNRRLLDRIDRGLIESARRAPFRAAGTTT
jgi:CubicO group peptidase (beta-lactamase class C family)